MTFLPVIKEPFPHFSRDNADQEGLSAGRGICVAGFPGKYAQGRPHEDSGGDHAVRELLFDEKGRPIRETAGEAIAQAVGFRPERISAASKTHQEYANLQAYFAEQRNDLFAKARLAMERSGDMKKVS